VEGFSSSGAGGDGSGSIGGKVVVFVLNKEVKGAVSRTIGRLQYLCRRVDLVATLRSAEDLIVEAFVDFKSQQMGQSRWTTDREIEIQISL
jgi:hypothetical protein